ncbi:hypothetical protein [Thalassospira mesophila]|nr:hypothetical protein [Thalassospira mesophila]
MKVASLRGAALHYDLCGQFLNVIVVALKIRLEMKMPLSPRPGR